MNKKKIGYILIGIIIVLLFFLVKTKSIEGFENDTIINIYNDWHLGDCLFVIVYLYNCKQYMIDNNIIINFYVNKEYINQLNEFKFSENINLYDITLKPNDSINTWIAADNYEYNNTSMYVNNPRNKQPAFNDFLATFYSNVGKQFNLPSIDNFSYIDEDLLMRYEKLDEKYKNIDILIINSEPKSGQYNYNKDEWDKFIYELSSKYKIVTSNKVENILCSCDNKLSIKDIAAISTNVDYVIAIHTGPLIPLFNKYTLQRVKQWFILDNERKFSYPNTVNVSELNDIKKIFK
jgi:hypothetical protein